MDPNYHFPPFPEPPWGLELPLGLAQCGRADPMPALHPFLTQQQALCGPWPVLAALVPGLATQVSMLAGRVGPQGAGSSSGAPSQHASLSGFSWGIFVTQKPAQGGTTVGQGCAASTRCSHPPPPRHPSPRY